MVDPPASSLRSRGAKLQSDPGTAAETSVAASASPAAEPARRRTSTCCFVQRTGDKWFDYSCAVAACLVVVCAVAEVTSSTPYGRFGIPGKGALSIGLHPKLGWWLMELPCSLVFWYQYFVVGGSQSGKGVPRFFAFLFCCHYFYRGWAFPLLLNVHPGSKNFDLTTAFGSWMVTVLHAYINARWYAQHGLHLGGRKSKSWTSDLRFRVGVFMYYTGLISIVYHDSLMRNLRPCPDGARYCIPRGGLFEYVTMGHYLSELWGWLGFAIASWGPNGAFIFLVSLVNLVPRSAATHQWYLDKFGDEYLQLQRARLVPGIW